MENQGKKFLCGECGSEELYVERTCGICKYCNSMICGSCWNVVCVIGSHGMGGRLNDTTTHVAISKQTS